MLYISCIGWNINMLIVQAITRDVDSQSQDLISTGTIRIIDYLQHWLHLLFRRSKPIRTDYTFNAQIQPKKLLNFNHHPPMGQSHFFIKCSLARKQKNPSDVISHLQVCQLIFGSKLVENNSASTFRKQLNEFMEYMRSICMIKPYSLLFLKRSRETPQESLHLY